MAGKVNGFALAYTALGGLLIYSGIKGTSLTATFTGLTHGTLDSTAEASATAAATAGGTATAAAGNTGAETQSASANQALAQQVIAANPSYAGWGSGDNWQDLLSLWNQESGWNNTADNPASGAYGIAQALPATKYPAAGQPPPTGTSDAQTQIEWGLSYILSRYGSPSMAWAHEVANGWY
jgi:Transglycosylase SLT domain